MSVERCVCCGEAIPEGRQICMACERPVVDEKPKMNVTIRVPIYKSILYIVRHYIRKIFKRG